MKYCKNCGAPIDDNAIFCTRCGNRVNGDGPTVNFNTFSGGYNTYGGYGYPQVDNEPSKIIAVLSFMFWWVGLAVWIFTRHTRPGKARSALKGLLASACFSLPILGAVMWALWKGDPGKNEYAKVASRSAIVGAIFYAVWALLSVVAVLTGALDAGYYVEITEAITGAASLR